MQISYPHFLCIIIASADLIMCTPTPAIFGRCKQAKQKEAARKKELTSLDWCPMTPTPSSGSAEPSCLKIPAENVGGLHNNEKVSPVSPVARSSDSPVSPISHEEYEVSHDEDEVSQDNLEFTPYKSVLGPSDQNPAADDPKNITQPFEFSLEQPSDHQSDPLGGPKYTFAPYQSALEPPDQNPAADDSKQTSQPFEFSLEQPSDHHSDPLGGPKYTFAPYKSALEPPDQNPAADDSKNIIQPFEFSLKQPSDQSDPLGGPKYTFAPYQSALEPPTNSESQELAVEHGDDSSDDERSSDELNNTSRADSFGKLLASFRKKYPEIPERPVIRFEAGHAEWRNRFPKTQESKPTKGEQEITPKSSSQTLVTPATPNHEWWNKPLKPQQLTGPKEEHNVSPKPSHQRTVALPETLKDDPRKYLPKPPQKPNSPNKEHHTILDPDHAGLIPVARENEDLPQPSRFESPESTLGRDAHSVSNFQETFNCVSENFPADPASTCFNVPPIEPGFKPLAEHAFEFEAPPDPVFELEGSPASRHSKYSDVFSMPAVELEALPANSQGDPSTPSEKNRPRSPANRNRHDSVGQNSEEYLGSSAADIQANERSMDQTEDSTTSVFDQFNHVAHPKDFCAERKEVPSLVRRGLQRFFNLLGEETENTRTSGKKETQTYLSSGLAWDDTFDHAVQEPPHNWNSGNSAKLVTGLDGRQWWEACNKQEETT